MSNNILIIAFSFTLTLRHGIVDIVLCNHHFVRDDVRLQVAPLATNEQADARYHGDAE